jgi:hypothetical protein
MSRKGSSRKHGKRKTAAARPPARLAWPVWARWGVPIVPVVVVLAVFLPAVDYGFTNYDVPHQLLEYPVAQRLSASNVVRMFAEPPESSYYPVRTLSFAIDSSVWGRNSDGTLSPWGYHLTNVLLHALSVVLLYRLMLRLRPASQPLGAGVAEQSTNAEGQHAIRYAWPIAAALAALLFALHPVVVEPVVWIAGREEVLTLLFALLCLHAHRSAVQSGGRRRVAFHVVSAVACAAASLCNAVAAAIPFIVMAHDATLVADRRGRPGRILAGTWYLWLIGCGAFVAKWISAPDDRASASANIPIGKRALVILDNYFRNIGKLVWPFDLAAIYGEHVPASILAPGVLIGLGLVVLTLAAMWFAWRRPLMLFGLLWFVFGLAPSSQIVPHHIYRADRFCYLALPGLALALAAGGVSLAGLRAVVGKVAAVGALVVGVLLGVRSADQRRVWHDSFTLYNHCLRLRPGALAYFNRGLAYDDLVTARKAKDVNKTLGLALADYTEAIKCNPAYGRAYDNRGTVYGALERYEDALADFNKAIEINPDEPLTYFNRGLTYEYMKQFDAARADYEAAIRLAPKSVPGRQAAEQLRKLPKE